MIYLKAIIKKLTNETSLIKKASEYKDDKKLLEFLLTFTSQDEIEKAFTHHYGVRYNKIFLEEIDEDLLKEFNGSFLEKEVILPYSFDALSGKWKFAISNLVDRNLQDRIKRVVNQKNQSVEFTFLFNFEIYEIYNKLKGKTNKEIVIDEKANYDATSWVDMAINNGIQLGASDIHIEREETGLQVRYRVDGVMTNKYLFTLSDGEISNIYVRLKIIGNMDISEKRKSQDGRIDHYEHKGSFYSLRVSTVNTINGEKFVMRLFSETEKTLNFDDLGFTSLQQEKIMKMINKSNGIVYLAGATGSGKTTTLYTMINNLDVDALNVYTIESPVEKGITGVNQIQIDEASGNTYPSVLKTLLRQDPDVMAVGEIRERETAQIAVQASLTGHLVLTTIHANSALDSLSRLVDIGIENYLIGASSVGFISQRLARRLCPHCKQKVETIPDYQNTWIKQEVEDFDYEIQKQSGNFFYENFGCDHCVNGYKGRIAILEMIEVDDEMKSMISRGASTKEIKTHLITNNFKNLKFDGISKALDGVTSVQEIMGKLQG